MSIPSASHHPSSIVLPSASAIVRAGRLSGGLVLMLVALGALVLRCTRRLGGITGDVLGAAVEISLAVLLLAAA